MYSLAFFCDEPSFREEKLARFFKKCGSQIFLYMENQHLRLPSIAEIPQNYDGDCPFWVIHDRKPGRSPLPTPPTFPWGDITSFIHINNLFQWFAQHYTWVIFPWCPEVPSHFVFLSSTAALRDMFVTCSPNALTVSKGRRRSYNMLISYYDVPSQIEDVCQAIVFREGYGAGQRVWDACHCSVVPPYCVRYLERSGMYRDNTATREVGYEMCLYRPPNNAAFLATCYDYEDFTFSSHFNEVFPGTLDVDAIQSFLSMLREPYRHPKYLSYVPDCLRTIEWFYAVGCLGVWGHQYSLFVSRDNHLIKTILRPTGTIEDQFGLVACF